MNQHAAVESAATGLSKSLSSRRVTMISIGGIIGAGLFVGSSAAIAAVGPAIVVSASGALMLIVYLMACFAHLKLRRQFERTQPGRLTIRVWLFPWLSWLTIIAMAAVFVAMAFTKGLASQLYASLLCFGLVLAAHFATRKRYRLAIAAVPAGSC